MSMSLDDPKYHIEGSNSLADLAARISGEHDEIVASLRQSLVHAMAAGDMLIEAKAMVGHGEWLPWLAEHCRIPKRSAQLYMRLAKHRELIETKSADVALLTINAAIELIDIRPNLREMVEDVEAAANAMEAVLVECRKAGEMFDEDIAALAVAINGCFVTTAETLNTKMRNLKDHQPLIDREQDATLLQFIAEVMSRVQGIGAEVHLRALRYAGILLALGKTDKEAKAAFKAAMVAAK